ncbi:MAG: chromosome segregation protein SMC [Saprospiraceae bacterium]|nr:chromosome segregation protein SMC [Candidatus Defluviibacterium haderslevense]
MRLKNLEIKGFKSFADDTVIHFNEAVTGIVGPNGSGKSNIVDAIRWVLGEQKGRELRLEHMVDVIFNGTKKRKEAPLAQVTLTFENTKNLLPLDYHNISISRLLYRSGESEYRLNNVTCRLKDITSLFLDTGVGSDSYAIIALGMVEDILSNKENARRKMFEQAAGISKYKARKRESINKLKATNEDLARIEDLLFEINNNLVELEKQAKRTKKFFEMRDKYKSTGLLLAHISVQRLKEKIQGLNTQIEAEIIKVQDQEVALHQSEADHEKFKKSHLDQEKNLGDFQRKVNEILDSIRLTESEIQIKEQKKLLIKNQQEHVLKSSMDAKSKIEVLKQDILLIETEIAKTTLEVDKVNAYSSGLGLEYTEIQSRYDGLKIGVDQYYAQKQQLEKQVFDLEKEIAIQLNQYENFDADTNRNKDELEQRTNEFKSIQQEIDDSNKRIQDIQVVIADISKAEEERQATLVTLRSQIDAQTQKIGEINRRKDAKKNEYELLKSMVEKMEGFPESIRFLNQNWRKDVPVLTDLIYTDEKYRSAIELYLESTLNYYVVHSESEAVHAIRLLFSNAKGKANFFILDKFKNEITEPSVIPGCISAYSLIEVDSIYKPLLNYLLKDVYIQEHDSQLEDVIKFPDEVSVISLSGSIVKQKNTISGGSVGLFEGKKLGRKKHLEKLEQDIKVLESEVLDMDRALTYLKNEQKKFDLINKQQELVAARKQESEYLQRLAQISTKQQHFNELKERIELRIQDNTEKQITLRKNQEEKSIDLSKAKSSYQELINSISQSDQVFDKVSHELSQSAAAFNQSKLEVMKWQNTLDNITKDLEYKTRQIDESSRQLDHDLNNLNDQESELVQLDLDLMELKKNLEDRFEFKKNMEADLSSLEQEYYTIRNTISEYEGKIRTAQRNISDIQSMTNSLKDQRSEFNYRIQSSYEKAMIEFNTNIDDFVPDQETEGMEEEQLRDRAMYYKVRLDNYGEINPLALEAYEEMKTRFDKIQEQRLDIQTAQVSLLETIKEIEETATANFLMAFNQVRVHFQDVFRSLFTSDDDCDLILLDENDPLECDIDIVAKPKGKRPKSIHQLSGGEKTLTAIALLFSLYLLKPAPFCIFDEVDAPLDDINIEKFNTIIRKFSSDSQFIIITHNKLTMAEVDVLYGVYMEQQGISNVAAVDFRKYEHDVVLSGMEN